MNCPKCGKQINDTATFCPFCGHNTEVTQNEQVKTEPKITNQGFKLTPAIIFAGVSFLLCFLLPSLGIVTAVVGIICGIIGMKNPDRKKWSKIGMVAAICTFVICIVASFSGGSSSKSEKKENKQQANEQGYVSQNEGASGSDAVTTEISFDKICEQCPGCQNAIYTYYNLLGIKETGSSRKRRQNDFLTYAEQQQSAVMPALSDDYIGMYLQKKAGEMQNHYCTADVIEVENMPYAYRFSTGSYTGQWQGAGPMGRGTYRGIADGKYVVSYSGEWKYGLPDGYGELYEENAYNGWDMEYQGYMSAGKRNGAARMIEYNKDSHPPKYRIYADTSFRDDIMCVDTECVEYDAETGEVYWYWIMNGDDNGWVYAVNEWGPDELSPADKQALQFAECAIVIGVVGYMLDAAVSSEGFDYDKANTDMLTSLNNWREQKTAMEQQSSAREQEEQEAYRNYCSDQYDKLHAQDPSDWSLDAQYFKNNMR